MKMITIEFPQKRLQKKSLLGILLIGLVFLSGCYFPSFSRIPDSKIFDNVSGLVSKPVNIQFHLQLPEPDTETERYVIEILDDVTGLPFNFRRYDLDKYSDQSYGTTLSLPSGSIIKYRYGKIKESLIPEITATGDSIPYRLYYATTNDRVTDLLQGLRGEPTDRSTGRLIGTLVDHDTDLPLSDILVFAGGRRTFTDTNGKFLLEGLSEGVHNVVFYAMDGKYLTYQQGALIQSNMTTPADVKLFPMPMVNVTFEVNTPNDALGAPIFMAGNIIQLGHTFNDAYGSMRVKPKQRPILTATDDGIQTITLQLYAETDLRYKFTLGNGYWNAEQLTSGGFRTRQLIVPTKDVTINHTIETWRTSGFEPITFSVSIPPGTSPFDEKSIQFQAEERTEPIPLWPVGNGNYLYILFSPFDTSTSISYQFCRNGDCEHAADMGSPNFERQVQPTESPQTVTLTLDSWQNWYIFEKNSSIIDAYIPQKSTQYETVIELTPEMNSSWLKYVPNGLSELSQAGVNTLIFSPQWTVISNSPYIHPEIGVTPFKWQLMDLFNTAKSFEMDYGIFPQLGDDNIIENWWNSGVHTEAWYKAFFASYRDFALNYANIAQYSNAEQLILGGKSLLPAFEGGIYPDGSASSVPINFDANWLELLEDIRSIYDGKLIWATNVNLKVDPLPEFIFEFDGIYISVDSPLAYGEHPEFSMVQTEFTKIIDSQIYEVYRSTFKPITLALAYPAVDGAASGCALLNEICHNDGLFLSHNIAPFTINFDDQALIYNAILPIIASREWITGTSIRGYDPAIIVHDGTSSLSGKPAFDVIQYWFMGMKP